LTYSAEHDVSKVMVRMGKSLNSHVYGAFWPRLDNFCMDFRPSTALYVNVRHHQKMGFFSKVHKCAFHFHTRFVCQALLTAARLTVRSAVTPKSDCAAAEKFLVSKSPLPPWSCSLPFAVMVFGCFTVQRLFGPPVCAGFFLWIGSASLCPYLRSLSCRPSHQRVADSPTFA